MFGVDDILQEFGRREHGDADAGGWGDNAAVLEQGFFEMESLFRALGGQVARAAGSPEAAALADEARTRAQQSARDAYNSQSQYQKNLTDTPLLEGDFWSHPWSVFSTQLIKNAPTMFGMTAATAAAGLAGGPGAALATGGALGGMVTAGDYIDNAVSVVENLTRADLDQVPYAQKRFNEGASEAEVKEELRNMAVGKYRPFLAGVLGIATGIAGPETLLASSIASPAAREAIRAVTGGRVKSAVAGGALGGVTEGIEEGVPTSMTNEGIQEAGLGDVAPDQDVGSSFLQGLGLGAPLGFIGGFVGGGRHHGHQSAPNAPVINEPGKPDPAQEAALQPPPKPVPQKQGSAQPGPSAGNVAAPPAAGPTAMPGPAAVAPQPVVPKPAEAISEQAPAAPEPAAAQTIEDPSYEKAKELVWTDGKVSTSYIQRKLGLGYNKAAQLVDRMEQDGIVSPAGRQGKRTILVGRDGQPVDTAAAPTPVEPPSPIYTEEQIQESVQRYRRDAIKMGAPQGPGLERGVQVYEQSLREKNAASAAPVTSEVGIPEEAPAAAPEQPVEGPPVEQGQPVAAPTGEVATTPTPEIDATQPTPIETPEPATIEEATAPQPAALIDENFRGGRLFEAAPSPIVKQALDVDAERRAVSDNAAKVRERARTKQNRIAEGTWNNERHDLNAEQRQKRDEIDPAAARDVFASNMPSGEAEYRDNAALAARLDKVVAAAKAANIDVPKLVTDGIAPEIMWLVNAGKVLRALRTNPGSKVTERMKLDFAAGEVAAAAGDWDVMRSGHGGQSARGARAGAAPIETIGGSMQALDENDAAMREQAAIGDDEAGASALAEAGGAANERAQASGEVEIVPEGKDEVSTVVGTTARREANIDDMTEKKVIGNKVLEVARATGAAKTVTVDPEMAAKYVAMSNANAKKPAERPVVSEFKEEAVAPERVAVKPPETPAAKVRAKAKAPPKDTPEVTKPKVESKAQKAARTGKPKTGAEVVANVKQARKDVDTKPTNAQKKAGNYRKGHFHAVGLGFTMETPAGEYRTSTEIDPVTKAPKWAQKMKHDYGAIDGVAGADGDPMDVFFGSGVKAWVGKSPDAKHVFVIDQLDPKTGKFDEHKVMMFFDNAREASEAYADAFGGDVGGRFGGMRMMDLDEFKTWLKEGNKKDPIKDGAVPTALPHRIEDITRERDITDTGTLRSDFANQTLVDPAIMRLRMRIEDAREEMRIDAQDAALKNTAGAVELGGHWFKPEYSSTIGRGARFHLEGMKLLGEHAEVMRKIFETAAGAVPNTPVYYLKPEDMASAAGYQAAKRAGFDGMLVTNRADFKVPGNGYILIDASLDPERTTYVLAHEAIHAVAVDYLAANRDISDTMQEVLNHIVNTHGLHGLEATGDLYGLSNVQELLAELANPEFVALLRETPIPRALGAKLGLAGWRKATVWNTVIDFFRKILGLKMDQFSALDAVVSTYERASHSKDTAAHESYLVRAVQKGAFNDISFTDAEARADRARSAARILETKGRIDQKRNYAHMKVDRETAAEVVSNVRKRVGPATNTTKRILLRLESIDHIVRSYEHLFPEGSLRALGNAMARRTAVKNALNKTDDAFTLKAYNLLQKGDSIKIGDRTASQVFSDLVHDQSNWQIDVSVPLSANSHLGKDALHGWPAKKRYAALRAEYDALKAAAPELAAFQKEYFTHYRDKANEMTLAAAGNAVRFLASEKGNTVTDAHAREVADRIMSDTTTAADVALLGKEGIEQIEKTPELAKHKGPYAPQMRFGKFFVEATANVPEPTSGTWTKRSDIGGAVYDFSGKNARDKAVRYSGELNEDLYHTIKSVWTGPKGEEFYTHNGKDYKYNPDTGEQRFRVTVQDRHVAQAESELEAKEAAAKLSKDAFYREVGPVQKRLDSGEFRTAVGASASLKALTEQIKRAGVDKLPPSLAHELRLVLTQATYRAAPGNSVSKRRMQRKHVGGASRDTIRVLDEYNQSTNAYLSNLKTARSIDEAEKVLSNSVSNDYTADGKDVTRADVLNEMGKRREMRGAGDVSSPVIDSLVSIQSIDKLMSPAYSVLEVLQMGLVTVPELSAKHGVFNASRAVGTALSDIGFTNIVAKGGKGVWDAMRGKLGEATDYGDFVRKGKISTDEKAMFTALEEINVLDPDSGFQTSIAKPAGMGTKLLNRVENVFRQMPRAVNAMNRYATALAAYRLARKKGMGEEAARNYAADMVNKTLFNYDPANTSPIFSHPLGRIALQFKKYGLAMYQLMGAHVANIFKGATRAEKLEAARGLAYIFGAHVMAAGFMGGLPLEPLKAIVTAGNVFGFWGTTWDDVDIAARGMMADMVGPTIGEALMRGLPRLVDIDLSPRVGLENLMLSTPFGDMSDPADRGNYFWQLVGGPTGGMIGSDLPKVVQSMRDGDLLQALEYAIPVKMASDTLRAARYYTQGKTTEAGDVITTYNLPEAIMRTIGFGSGSESERSLANSAVFRANDRRNKARTELMRQRTDLPFGEFLKRMNAFNKANPDNKVTLADVNRYVNDHKKRLPGAISDTPANRSIMDRLEGVFPTR